MKLTQFLSLLISTVIVGAALAAEPTAPAKPGSIYIHPITGKRMILVPSGYYEANPETASQGGSAIPFRDENGKIGFLIQGAGRGQSFVTGCYMDESEVTNGEYAKFVRDNKAAMPQSWSGKIPEGDDLQLPVKVKLQEASAYAVWARLRLPGIYEFFAATAKDEGDRMVFPWISKVVSPTQTDTYWKSQWSPTKTTALDKSPLGVFDLAGNAPEWGNGYQKTGDEKLYLRFFFYPGFVKKFGNEFGWMFILEREEGNPTGFRCVDDKVAASALVKKTLVAAANLKPNSPVTAKVKIVSKSKNDLLLRLSNLREINLPAGQTVQEEIPIGDYLLLILNPKLDKQLVRFWRTVAQAPGFEGFVNEWEISDSTGEELK